MCAQELMEESREGFGGNDGITSIFKKLIGSKSKDKKTKEPKSEPEPKSEAEPKSEPEVKKLTPEELKDSVPAGSLIGTFEVKREIHPTKTPPEFLDDTLQAALQKVFNKFKPASSFSPRIVILAHSLKPFIYADRRLTIGTADDADAFRTEFLPKFMSKNDEKDAEERTASVVNQLDIWVYMSLLVNYVINYPDSELTEAIRLNSYQFVHQFFIFFMSELRKYAIIWLHRYRTIKEVKDFSIWDFYKLKFEDNYFRTMLDAFL